MHEHLLVSLPIHSPATHTSAGPTGCGKSSLVNALAGRLPAGGTLEGEVLVNGLPRGRGFKSITAYVMQVGAGTHPWMARLSSILVEKSRC